MFNVGSIKLYSFKGKNTPSLKCIVHVPMRIKWGYQFCSIKVSSCKNQFIVFSVMYFSKCV